MSFYGNMLIKEKVKISLSYIRVDERVCKDFFLNFDKSLEIDFKNAPIFQHFRMSFYRF